MADALTSDQERAVSELRQLIKDLPDEEYEDSQVLLNFLIARQFNVKRTESMIRKNFRWKKEVQVDTLWTDFKPSEVLQKYTSFQSIGFDKERSIVRYMPLGKLDGIGIHKSTNMVFYFKHVLRSNILEDKQILKSQNRKFQKAIHIYDVSELSFAQMTHVPSMQDTMKIFTFFQDNYPEYIKKIYVINAPKYFATFWVVIKKCFGSELMNKISIYGKDGWKDELLKTIDAEVLPAFLGGKRTDPDGNPLCLTLINHLYEPIPKAYFLEKNIENMAQKHGVKAAKINRQERMTETIEVTELNCIINWEFELKHYDIGFGILLENTDRTIEELIPVHKIETELEPYIGMYRCKKPGKYLIEFDNSYSWFHLKEIYYRFWITTADTI